MGVAGTRLWDCPDFSFGAQIDFKENPKANKEQKEKPDTAETRKIWERELSRLELSLKCLDARDQVRLAMVTLPTP